MQPAVDESERTDDSQQMSSKFDDKQKNKLHNVSDKIVFHMILDAQNNDDELRLLDKLPFDSERPIDELDIPDYKILNIMISHDEKRWK